MSEFQHPIAELVMRRVSHRAYRSAPIPPKTRAVLQQYLSGLTKGPLGTDLRFQLVAASEDDRSALRGLGTYGAIHENTGFMLGAMTRSPMGIEDFGYAMEQIVLLADDLGLGTCWLGGNFTRSTFAARIQARPFEQIPAVLAVGVIEGVPPIPRRSRLRWDQLFFHGDFQSPLPKGNAGRFAESLEMVRLGPSASNKQPWRILRKGTQWHFYLQRTKGYRRNIVTFLLQVDDIQRVDIGIAMCHFEWTAREAGLAGQWRVQDPGLGMDLEGLEYRITWQEMGSS
jgi:nitroreductase